MAGSTTIHRYGAGPEGALVNAYLIEGPDAVVIVDGTLTIANARALRRRADELGKPMAGVVVTHAHPDHYGGIVEVVGDDDLPVIATKAVDGVIRRDDELKESILRPMFGEEWPHHRKFPTTTVEDGELVEIGGIALRVLDLGPGESPADSVWTLEQDPRLLFVGDQVYNHMHAYLADGFYEQWLQHLSKLEDELPRDAVLHMGHGDPGDLSLIPWQKGYIDAFVGAVQDADWNQPEAARAGVVAEAKRYLGTDDLLFLMELSVDPVAMKLGLLPPEDTV